MDDILHNLLSNHYTIIDTSIYTDLMIDVNRSSYSEIHKNLVYYCYTYLVLVLDSIFYMIVILIHYFIYMSNNSNLSFVFHLLLFISHMQTLLNYYIFIL